ncbi:MAG: PEP-CTERM sorting domain-containing protein [Janthinobacterium lividum]
MLSVKLSVQVMGLSAMAALFIPAAHAEPIFHASFTDEAVTRYTYSPDVHLEGWNFGYNTGITNGSNAFNVTAPSTEQVAFIQGLGAELSTQISTTGGALTLLFDAQGRARNQYGTNPLWIYPRPVDAAPGANSPPGPEMTIAAYFLASNGTFSHYTLVLPDLAAGTYKMMFAGLGAVAANSVGRDVTTFIDNVSISSAASNVPEAGTLALFTLGMVGFTAMRSRAKAAINAPGVK